MNTELGLLRNNLFINEKKIIALEDAFMQLRKPEQIQVQCRYSNRHLYDTTAAF